MEEHRVPDGEAEALEEMTEYFDSSISIFHHDNLPDCGVADGGNLNDTCISSFPVVFNDVILRRIFTFLNWETLFNCRMVCNKWKIISEPYFRKRSRIFFDFDKEVEGQSGSGVGDCSSEDKMLANLEEIFESCTESENPFTAFRFKGVIPLNIPVLEVFFKEQGNFIKELTLERVTLKDALGKMLQSYNISPLIGSNTTKLNVDCEFSTDFIVSLDRLRSIQYLTLRGCRVILNGNRVSPREVHLSFIRRDGEDPNATDIVVNDFLDFHQMKKLKLRGDSVAVDMSQAVIFLNSLHLERGKVLNWARAKWDIDKVTLKRVRFVNQNEMKIKELEIIDSSVNISKLPKMIERVILARNSEITCGVPVSFPNLTYLQLRHNNISCVTYFANCPMLRDIHLKTNSYSRLDLNSIPKTVERMKLEEIEIIGDGSHEIDTLILKDYTWDNIDRLLTKLLPKNLLVKMDCIKENDAERVFYFLDTHLDGKNIFLGRFVLDEEAHEFQSSLLSKWIDGTEEYYFFKDNSGKPVGKPQFEMKLKL